MKRQILAGATALVLASGMTTSAMAFSHGGGHVGSIHAGAIGPMHSFGGSRFAGVRGYSGWRHGGWGGRRFVGGYGGGWGYGGWGYPYDAYAADVGVVGLGLGLAAAATGYGYGYCGPTYGPTYYGYYGTPINAWSW